MDTEVSRSEKRMNWISVREGVSISMKKGNRTSGAKFPKTRYGRESVLDEESEQDIDGELDGEQVADESTAATKSAFRSESIRGQPRGERAYLETVADSRDLRKKRWSEIMRQKKDGRKRRLPKKARRQREKLPGTGKL